MKILLGPTGKPLVSAGGRLVEPCQIFVARVTLSLWARNPGPSTSVQTAGSIEAIWRSAASGSTDCIASSVPQPVSTVSGHLNAPCLYDARGNSIRSNQATSFTAVAEATYNRVNIRASATTPAQVTLAPGAGISYDGSASDADSDATSYGECSLATTSLSATASGDTRISSSYRQGESLDSFYHIEAKSSVTAEIYSCGCCSSRYVVLNVEASGASGIATVESTLVVSTKNWGVDGKRVVVSGSFDASVAPGVYEFRRTKSGGAYVIIEWVG